MKLPQYAHAPCKWWHELPPSVSQVINLFFQLSERGDTPRAYCDEDMQGPKTVIEAHNKSMCDVYNKHNQFTYRWQQTKYK